MKGEGTVFAKRGKSFDPGQIPKAIKDAGFTAVGVIVVASGTLKRTDNALQFKVPGLGHPFLLLGGSQNDALSRGLTFVGKRVEITGRLQQKEGELPALTVNDLRELP